MVFLLLWGTNLFTAFVFFPFLLYLSWEYPPFFYSSSSFWNSFNLLVPCHKLLWGIAVCHGRKFSFPFLTMKFPEIDLHFLQIILLGYINSLSLVILAIPLQEALSKSNEIFETFKQETEKVGIHTFVTFHPVFQTCYPKNDAFLH